MNTLLVIGIVLFVLWLLGIVSSYTLGGAVHVLVVIAVILVIVWFIRGKG